MGIMVELAQGNHGVVTISLDGPFRITQSSGKILNLSSSKAQACLALLFTAKDLRHSRSWIADKLWSDKDTEHAQGNLRQVLAEIRQKICTHADILGADRRSIWLYSDKVRIARDGKAEFLEGIDIRDPEWEEWLLDQRLRGQDDIGALPQKEVSSDREPAARPSGRASFPVAIVLDRSASPDSQFLGSVFSETLARNILEVSDFEVRLSQEVEAGVTLNVLSFQKPTAGGIQLSLRQGKSGTFMWSSGRMFSGRAFPGFDNVDVLSLLAEAQEAAISGHLSQLPRVSTDSDTLAQIQHAARKIFSYDPHQVLEAERALEDICDAAPSAVSMAWLLVANRVLMFERIATHSKEWVEALDMRCAQAIALGPTNAFLLAAVSGAYIRFLDRHDEGLALARRAVRLNPASPYALDALAGALYLCGRYEEGYRLSRRVCALTANVPNAHFFEMSLCVASVLTGRSREALTLANSATALAPKFRAAWRYSVALNAHEGNFQRAMDAGQRLRSIEPDFSVDRLVNDVDYPVASIRKSNVRLASLREIVGN